VYDGLCVGCLYAWCMCVLAVVCVWLLYVCVCMMVCVCGGCDCVCVRLHVLWCTCDYKCDCVGGWRVGLEFNKRLAKLERKHAESIAKKAAAEEEAARRRYRYP